jgi:hypothetical protein
MGQESGVEATAKNAGFRPTIAFRSAASPECPVGIAGGEQARVASSGLLLRQHLSF